MAQSANTPNTTANANNEVVNSKSATSTTPKGDKAPIRVVETRDMWAVVFDHTATLLAKAVKGVALTSDDVDGFAFGKKVSRNQETDELEIAAKRSLAAKDQPNIRGYLYSLLAGFTSKKGIKHSKGTALETLNLEEIAKSVALGLWPKFNWDTNVGKAEPKQAKSLIAAVIAKL